MANLSKYSTPISAYVGPGSSSPLSDIIDGSTTTGSWNSYHGGTPETTDWVGLLLPCECDFTSAVFIAGQTFVDGGWYTAEPNIQVRINGTWTNVAGQSCSPAYVPSALSQFQTYTFSFTSTRGDGIRVQGTPGGSAYFTSCRQLTPNGTFAQTDMRSIGTRVAAFLPGGGANISVINNDVLLNWGSSDGSDSWDSYHGGGASAFDWVGYTFAASHSMDRIEFVTGLQFSDGGYFASSPPIIQTRISGIWTNVSGQTIVTGNGGQGGPAHTSYRPGDGSENYRRYLFKFTPANGDGIRVSGTPGGAAFFISCGCLVPFEALVTDTSGQVKIASRLNLRSRLKLTT